MTTIVTTKRSRKKIGSRGLLGLQGVWVFELCGSHSGALAGSGVSRNNNIGGAIGLATPVAISTAHGGHCASGPLARPTFGSAQVAIWNFARCKFLQSQGLPEATPLVILVWGPKVSRS